ncbi:cobalamin biosynthesis protein [Lysobacter korlensis]|uniref:Cobalamin biosynthesis protein n=1 Tax=Lysobacter korlensis TaxID=553636 RepID=A0ABV6RS25_9GAMM
MTERLLTLGIGCRRGITVQHVESAVLAALGARSLAQVRQVATIEDKTAEPGLVEFCHRHALPLRGIARDRIAGLAPEAFTESDAASRHVGVRAVSEPCALLGARNGVLVTAKTAYDGVTVAIAMDTLDAGPSIVSASEGVAL